jgi:hypothetical protein
MKQKNLIGVIIKLMEQVEQFTDKTGIQKKHYVLESISTVLGDELFETSFMMIDLFIEYIIEISKSKSRRLKLNQKKSMFLCI